MANTVDGYVEGNYIQAYQAELNPLRLPLILSNAGLSAPTISVACELGFGQGITANLHAAGSQVRWYGDDFNASQAAFARELAAVSGSQAQFFDESFAEFCARPDLPDFDFIGMHGVWSWISEQNRELIADFIRRKLKVGGAVYVSYNMQPGFAALSPIQTMLSAHERSMGAPGRGLEHNVDSALDFAQRVLGASPLYTAAHPQIIEQLRMVRGKNQVYLAHEYFNRHWAPMSFSAIAESLAAAKLEFACSANHAYSIDAWNLRADQLALLGEIPNRNLRETVRDLMTNTMFRMDYWVKGPRRLTPLEKFAALREQRVVLIRPRGDIPLKAEGALGEFNLLNALCDPVLDALADHVPISLRDIEQTVRSKNIPFQQLVDLVLTFIGIGAVAPAQSESGAAAAKPQTDRLNAFLCAKACLRTDVNYLASPVTGAGFFERGGRIALLFLHAIQQGKRSAEELAQHVAQIFQDQGVAILRDGKPLATAEEGSRALIAQAAFFVDKQLPVLKALQIA